MISRHFIFDETVLPFSSTSPVPSTTILDFFIYERDDVSVLPSASTPVVAAPPLTGVEQRQHRMAAPKDTGVE